MRTSSALVKEQFIARGSVSERISTALGRALAYCSGVGDGSLEGFVDRAAWELHHECALEFASFAIIIRRSDGSSFVGRPKELPALPVETLLGMLVEESGAQVMCRVRDHALDTVRFIDARFRTSIVLRLAVPKVLLPDGEAAVWVGLQGSATPKRVELAQTIATTISKWLSVYGPVLQSVKLFGERLAGLRVKLGEMTALAHDAKAPIGALKYLISDVAVEYPQIYDETVRLQDELLYIEKLLGKFSPKSAASHSSDDSSSDISTVVRRVCDRFLPESLERGNHCVVAFPFGTSARARISELDLERVVSNVVGNSVRYSGKGEIRIELHRVTTSQWIIRVIDFGPGIPQSVIDSVARGDVQSSPTSSHGWGVGLVACKLALAAQGGDLILTSSSNGSSVDIVVPEEPVLVQRAYFRGDGGVSNTDRVVRFRDPPGLAQKEESDVHVSPADVPSLVIAAPVDNEGDAAGERLIIVDDDSDHTHSLERLLTRKGVKSESFTTVDAACDVIVVEPMAVVLCDAHMPDGGAERLLQLLAASGKKVRLAVMSGEVNDELLYRFAALGAREFFAKPIDVDDLVGWVRETGRGGAAVSANAGKVARR